MAVTGEVYSTSDMVTMAYLMLLKIPLVSVEHEGNQPAWRATFVFRGGDDLDAALDNLAQGTALVDPVAFHSHLKLIKSIVKGEVEIGGDK